MLEKIDKSRIEDHGLSESEVLGFFEMLKGSGHPVTVQKPCTPEEGIFSPSITAQDAFISTYETQKEGVSISRFIPASGAATRMFAHLYDKDKDPEAYQQLIKAYDDLPFVEALEAICSSEDHVEEKLQKVIASDGLGYGDLPKGMIPFHRYAHQTLNAIEEQILETLDYGVNGQIANLHFTVAEDFLDQFKLDVDNFIATLDTDVNLNVTFSIQHPATDRPALLASGQPLRDEHGALVFRPGGHGSLIYNLNNIESDLVFIKNIDNTYRRDDKALAIRSKKLLGGIALAIRSTIGPILQSLRKGDINAVAEAQQAMNHWFGLDIQFDLNEEGLSKALAMLDKPFRVCGMVENTGEPGGGPFWVRMNDNDTLQIVEKAELDLSSQEQIDLLKKSTHFNPVDLVCSLTNERGEAYDLKQYIDENRYFISNKTYNGTSIRVMENPGLWNGAMAKWNTIFVAVPLETFRPVKTVNDLLRIEHQPVESI